MSLIGTMGSGVSALRTFMNGLEVIGDNIANVNTTAFKTSEAKYADSFSNILQQSTTNAPAIAVGTGVTLSSVTTNFTPGSLSSTGNPTDLGISGNGYFLVRSPSDGSIYATRAGDFRWDSNGYLVTPSGYRVQGATASGIGDIHVDAPPADLELKSVSIDRSGAVVEFYSDGSSATHNQILLQNFRDPAALMKNGNNLYTGLEAASPVSGSVALQADRNAPGTNGLGTIQAGSLELSNVDLTDQFANLITTQRSFQAGSRLITVSDSVLEDIVNLKQR